MAQSLRFFYAFVVATLATHAIQGQVPTSRGTAFGADSVRLYYEIVGRGADTVLFLHGTPSTMYSLARDFSQLGRLTRSCS